jgi:hypothetical protein
MFLGVYRAIGPKHLGDGVQQFQLTWCKQVWIKRKHDRATPWWGVGGEAPDTTHLEMVTV